MDGCEGYEELISAVLDGEASEEERRALKEHLETCGECAALYDDLLALHRLLPTLSEQPPRELMEKTLARLGEEKVVSLPERKHPSAKRWAPWAAAAAVCVALLGVAVIQAGLWSGGASTADAGGAPNAAAPMLAATTGETARSEDASPSDTEGPILITRSGGAEPEGESIDVNFEGYEKDSTSASAAPVPEPAAAPAEGSEIQVGGYSGTAGDNAAGRVEAPSVEPEAPESAPGVAVMTEEKALEILEGALYDGVKEPSEGGGAEIRSLGLSEDGAWYLFAVSSPDTAGKAEEKIYQVSLDGSQVLLKTE